MKKDEAVAVKKEVLSDPFSQVEEQIVKRNPKPIRLERLLKARQEAIEEFLIKFFEKWNDDRNTIYADDKKTQTPLGRRRSLGDIYQVCKYYYPNCTIREVINLLYNVLPKSMGRGFRSSYCNATKRRMWYFNPSDRTEFLNGEKNDEFGFNEEFYRKNLKK